MTFEGRDITADVDLLCDVCVVGSGAGGAVLAAGLAEAGLSVVVLEEGGNHTKKDFDLRESTAYPMLYQDRGGRTTSDLAITILQGRSVGGGTTVNWTTCYRTPDRILARWRDAHGLEGWSPEELAPHFAAVEQRLSIREWPEALVNPNNGVLLRGCRALGWEVHSLRRNVDGCANSGYCGMGCPVDGKQAMHLTYLRDALAAGLVLYADTKVERLELDGERVVAVHGVVLDRPSGRLAGPRVTVRPKVAVAAGGAINSPALLLRSGILSGTVGRRTFLHPVVALSGEHAARIDGWSGAPQSVASREHVDRGPEKVGFFLEVPPIHPMLAATSLALFGAEQRDWLGGLAHVATTLAVCVDGLVPGDEGGTVRLRRDGRIAVDYPFRPALIEAFRAAHQAMARVQLAGGAVRAGSLHLRPVVVEREADLPALAAAPYGAHEHAVFSAHQMGGCAMGPDPETSVVDPTLRHHRIPNLFVVDGSVLPTALGVNPSETIYALAHRARSWVGEAV